MKRFSSPSSVTTGEPFCGLLFQPDNGWLADKYGLFWQVTPAKFFTEWVKDPAGLQRVTHEVWQMKKLDLAKLQKAFAGK